MKAFIIFRDRVTYAKRCAAAMEESGLEVVIVDHGTTWPAALDWLESTGYTVLRRGPGHHPRSLWTYGQFWEICGTTERYVVTDPDVIPAPDGPHDWLAELAWLLDRSPGYLKTGLGLRLDNIPDHYAYKAQVQAWESQFWKTPFGDCAFTAPVDTTLALHVPLEMCPHHSWASLRTAPPYLAEHLPWYEDLNSLSDELKYYHEHAEFTITPAEADGRGKIGDL